MSQKKYSRLEWLLMITDLQSILLSDNEASVGWVETLNENHSMINLIETHIITMRKYESDSSPSKS